MAGERFEGSIAGRIIEVRFPFSGVVSSVRYQIGDQVKPGMPLATLDRTVLQKELDVQLADYEKERADFEIFHLKNPASDQITQYQKTAAQARLNTSVRAVELAKARLDQTVITSPVSGLVIDLGGLIPGIFITPSANPVCILDYSGFTFQFGVDQRQLSVFRQPHRARILLPDFGRQLDAITSPPLPGTSKGKFLIDARLGSAPDLLPGMAGEIELIE